MDCGIDLPLQIHLWEEKHSAVFSLVNKESLIIRNSETIKNLAWISFTDFCDEVFVGWRGKSGGPKNNKNNKKKTKRALWLLQLNWMFLLKSWQIQ